MTAHEPAPRVLVVENEPAVRAALAQALTAEGFQVDEANTPEQGLDLFMANPCPVVFADTVQPGPSVIGLLQRIKDTRPHTQIILVANADSLHTAIMALRCGADEYLIKPIENPGQAAELARQSFARIRRIRDNETRIAELQRQITELESANRLFREHSIRDAATGLFNQRHFQAGLAAELARAERHSRAFSLIAIEVDHLQTYIQVHGRALSNNLLSLLGQLLCERLRTSDTLAHLGSGNFVVIVPETGPKEALKVARSLCSLIESYPFCGCETQPQGCLTASLGLVSYPQDGTDATTLLQLAGRALQRAKEAGGDQVCFAGE